MGRDIAQCSVSLPEIKFGNGSQKARTNRYQTFLVLSIFSVFLYFVPKILFGIAVPNRRCLGYSTVYCDVRRRWLLAWNQNRYITYSVFHIPYTNCYIRHHFVCLGKLVDISYVNHFGAIMAYEVRTLQIPEPSHLHAVLLTRLAWHGRRRWTT